MVLENIIKMDKQKENVMKLCQIVNSVRPLKQFSGDVLYFPSIMLRTQTFGTFDCWFNSDHQEERWQRGLYLWSLTPRWWL